MAGYVAKDNERLEEVYYSLHGVDDGRYYEFCLLNHTLLRKDRLEAGDTVLSLPEKEIQPQERLKLWQ